MNIDDMLNDFLVQVGLRPTIEYWRWHGRPGFTAQDAPVPKPIDWSVGYIIFSSTDAECLNSKSEYVRECKAWLNNNRVPQREWSLGLSNYSHAVMHFVHMHRPKSKECCCGAKHTSFPNIHSHWCDAYVQI